MMPSQVVLCPRHRKGGAPGCAVSGVQRSGASPTLSPKNVRGATPTIVKVAAFRRKLRPTTEGSRANRRAQNASLMTATSSPTGSRSSAGSSVRPADAATPSVVK
jgi:hypothetical protein